MISTKNTTEKRINKYMNEITKFPIERIGKASVDNSPLIYVITICLIASLYEKSFIQLLLAFPEHSMKLSTILMYPFQTIDEQYNHYINHILKDSLKNKKGSLFKKFHIDLLNNDFISASEENTELIPNYSINTILLQVLNFLCYPDMTKNCFLNGSIIVEIKISMYNYKEIVIINSEDGYIIKKEHAWKESYPQIYLKKDENKNIDNIKGDSINKKCYNKLQKQYFSEEKNHKKILKYKRLLKETRLNIHIQKINELLLSEEEFNQVYQEIKQMAIKNKMSVKFPIYITLGGQPGSGKSNIYNIAKKRFSNNIVEIDCDAFRVFHPYYNQIKNVFGKEDACKTNPFVFKVVDLLIEELSEKKYNLIIESSLNSPYSALQNGKSLPPKGYKVELHIMATPKDISWQGTIDRYNKELKKGGSSRAVSKEFHDNVVKNIVHSLGVVKESGLMSNILMDLIQKIMK